MAARGGLKWWVTVGEWNRESVFYSGLRTIRTYFSLLKGLGSRFAYFCVESNSQLVFLMMVLNGQQSLLVQENHSRCSEQVWGHFIVK